VDLTGHGALLEKSSLRRAIRMKSRSGVIDALDCASSFDFTDELGRTALHDAIACGWKGEDLAWIIDIVGTTALWVRDRNGLTAIDMASVMCDAETFDWIVHESNTVPDDMHDPDPPMLDHAWIMDVRHTLTAKNGGVEEILGTRPEDKRFVPPRPMANTLIISTDARSDPSAFMLKLVVAANPTSRMSNTLRGKILSLYTDPSNDSLRLWLSRMDHPMSHGASSDELQFGEWRNGVVMVRDDATNRLYVGEIPDDMPLRPAAALNLGGFHGFAPRGTPFALEIGYAEVFLRGMMRADRVARRIAFYPSLPDSPAPAFDDNVDDGCNINFMWRLFLCTIQACSTIDWVPLDQVGIDVTAKLTHYPEL
jgi:hypothetical protein